MDSSRLQPAAALQLQAALAVQRPAALPLLLVLIPARVSGAGLGLDVVEVDVLRAGPVGPGLLAGHRAGVAADALVQVHHHRDLRHDPHQNSHLLRAAADDGDLVALVAGRPVVVEREGQLPVPADHVGGLDDQPGQRVVRAAVPAGDLRLRRHQVPVLGVVHEHRALRHPVRHHGPAGDHPVAVVRLDPVVVGDADRRRVGGLIQITGPPRNSRSMCRLSAGTPSGSTTSSAGSGSAR